MFWSLYSSIRTENGDLQGKSPYSLRMRENMDQKNSECKYFLRNVCFFLRMNKILTRGTILVKSIVVLAIRRISELTEAQNILEGIFLPKKVMWLIWKKISFIRQLRCKFSIMDSYWEVKKGSFTRIFIFLLEFQLIRIIIIAMINIIIECHRSSINKKTLENIRAFRRFCFFVWKSHIFS